jgi:TPR repeat protein|nr:MAG TPA: hypothetical protein [Caudoviricetes sp.]
MDDYLANLFEKLKSNKDANTYVEIGYCYLTGRHTTKNEQNAMYYFQEAANMGDAKGEFWVGFLYYRGTGVRKDVKRASKFFKSAADKGDLDAMYLLGQMYFDGDIGWGKGRAFEWWMKAAKKNHAKSQMKVGYCYLIDVGEDTDPRKATYWLVCAYLQGAKDKKASDEAKGYLDWMVNNRRVSSDYVQSVIERVRVEHPEYLNK